MVVNGNDDGTRAHAVVIAGGGPTGMALAAELTLAGVDAVVVERRTSHELESSRAGGLHARTIEVFDQRGVAERFLAAGEVMQIVGYSQIQLDLSDFPDSEVRPLLERCRRSQRLLIGLIVKLSRDVSRSPFPVN